MRGSSGGEPDISNEENKYMQRTRGWRAAVLGVTGVLGVGLAMTATLASPARAADDLDGYQGEAKKDVKVEAVRTYDAAGNRTTFRFTLTTNGENVSHVLVVACQGIEVVSVTGPQGANQEAGGPKKDPSLDGEEVTGFKFEPGVPGAYTIVLVGDIAAADFVVKDGTGHKHYPSGPAAQVCQPSAQQSPNTPNPPANEPPANNPPANNPPAENPPSNNPPANNPPASPASNQPGQPDTQVQGAQLANNPPGSEVLAGSLAQPQAQATLPRTGSDVTLLVPIGAMLVAFGGVARAAARRG
jgi:hypothetical protein